MTEMIDRVARVFCCPQGCYARPCPEAKLYEARARAAIEAMPWPRALIELAAHGAPDKPIGSLEWSHALTALAERALIDAALSPNGAAG